MDDFKKDYELLKNKKSSADRIAAFKGIAKKFAEGAAKSAGAGVVKVLKAHLGIV